MNLVNPEQAWEKYNETFWAYLAGLLDGEGCIAVYRNKGRRAYGIGISVSQKDDYILKFLQSMLGGNINHHNMKNCYGGNFVCPAWRVYAKKKVRYILERCLPYFIIKKAQAELTIKAIDLLWGKHLTRYGALATPQHIIGQLEELRLEISALKRRPIAAVETKRENSEKRSDSPDYRNDKSVESTEMIDRLPMSAYRQGW